MGLVFDLRHCFSPEIIKDLAGRRLPTPRQSGYNAAVEYGYRQVSDVQSGKIDPALARHAYQQGYFPMGERRGGDEYAWFTHDPRGIIPLEAGLHISKSLRKSFKRGVFQVTCDTAFSRVIDACAGGRGGDAPEATWISKSVKHLFMDFFEAGAAHSIECWQDQALVGGLYGVHIGGGVFCGESMFSKSSNASKIALIHLTAHLGRQGFTLLDVQQTTPHTSQMGAIDIDEDMYLQRLGAALTQDVEWGRFDPRHTLESVHQPPYPAG